MDPLVKRRKALKLKANTLKSTVDQHAASPLDEISVVACLEKLSNLRKENESLNNDILPLCNDDKEIANNQDFYEDIEETLYKLKINLLQIKKTFGTTSATVSSSSTPADIRLPKLDLPTFSGIVQEWISFHDLFCSAIHTSSKLSGAQKLQYLKASLKGDAALLIQHYEIKNDNYDEAWKVLINRYENKREIIKAHLNRLISQQVLQQESPEALRRLIDTTNECVKALQVLKIPVDTWGDLIVIHIIASKLDQESRLQWERSLKNGTLPTYTKTNNNQGKSHHEKKATLAHHGATDSKSCVMCNGAHYLFQCQAFLNNSISDRRKAVREKHLCYNCLRHGHSSKDCKSKYSCKTCNQKHSTLLHLDSVTTPEEAAEKKTTQETQQPVVVPETTENAASHSHFSASPCTQVLLSTALIKVMDKFGNPQVCRALLDNGSQSSFVTNSCVNRLGHKRQKANIPIIGLGETGVGLGEHFVQLQFNSCYNSKPSFNIDALIMDKITIDLPSHSLQPTDQWSHINNLLLADPRYYHSEKIDILLGADIVATLMSERKISGPEGTPIAQETVLGWILSGKIFGEVKTKPLLSHHIHCDLDSTLRKFWELEEIPKKNLFTPEEKKCEQHFEDTHSRQEDGRYIVKLPFRTPSKTFGNSRDKAVRRLLQMERRLSSHPEDQQEYNKVLSEYLDLGHMEEIPKSELSETNKESPQPGISSAPTPIADLRGAAVEEGKRNQVKGFYYMPHHGVFKKSSTSTKLRVVFDASAKSSNGISLNDVLMVGPKLQEDLISILMRFRIHQVAFTADIVKMYRQFQVQKEDTDYQRIVWRTSPDEEIKDYRLLTATFGTASAPYLAVKCMQQLAKDEKKDFPEASEIILRDLYVDDLMSGADCEDKALQLQEQLLGLMQRGKLELRKWSSNSSALLAALPPEMRETNLPLRIDLDTSIKTLGLYWHPAGDQFSFTVDIPEFIKEPTKRIMLSENAKIFDPLGWLSPVTITAKILFQDLWRCKLDWDDPLPEEIINLWLNYRNELLAIQDIKINRCVTIGTSNQDCTYQLCGFCDSSEKAYSAVIYLRTVTADGSVSVNLVVAKSKVAPIKTVTLPKLELCGAVMLTKLITCTKESLKLNFNDILCWTDSTIVLDWLASQPPRWNTFVANRVSEIHDNAPFDNWSHVKSEENPADCASRGIPPSSLKDHPLWWHGPDWLQQATLPSKWKHGDTSAEALAEERKNIISHVTEIIDRSSNVILNRYSTLTQLSRLTAYIFRFVNNCKNKTFMENRKELFPIKDIKKLKIQPLSVQELNAGLLHWVKIAQHDEFKEEIISLKNRGSLSKKSKILNLNPKLDENGFLRVGGRLLHAKESTDRKNPTLLPKKHIVTSLIVRHYHFTHLHAGPQLLLSVIQNRFWIPSGRDVVRSFVRKCVKCHRHTSESAHQLMADLPAARVNISRPFLKCGVDYAGPFSLYELKGRFKKEYKSYIALFVCFVTKAVHLELVTDMTTEAFLAALKRFIARRGKCSDIHSDNGSNFVGADNEMKKYMKIVNSDTYNKDVQKFLTNEGINWIFNPPSAPHFGGIWESGVKSVKFHLKRIVGTRKLTLEEMITVLAQIEACLNSRPITPLSSSPDDLTALTPAHFIIGDVLTAIPEKDYTDIPQNRLSHWEVTQQFVQHFWKRWSAEYLSTLQQRSK